MSISDLTTRRLPDPTTSTAPGAGGVPVEARPPLVDRFEICLECEMLIGGAVPAGLDPEELREIERGVARLSAERGRTRVALAATGTRVGHRARPCACCRRPVAGDRAVLERRVTDAADS